MVFDEATAAFLEGGCALIVATAGPDGAPHATRGWGFTVLDRTAGRGRLLLPESDSVARSHLAPGGAIAVTGADVRTLRSLQMKGRSLGLDTADGGDRIRAESFIDRFFTDITETDGTAREILDRLIPTGYVACTIEVDEIYDQTPGPRAGTSMNDGGRA